MTSTNSWFRAGALAVLLMTPTFAQGDDCSVATAITGIGNWNFDTTAATTTSFSGSSGCSNAGSLDVGPDLFYQWTADVAGPWKIDTCGSSYDTKLNIHAGTGCAATCLDYNDDGPCGNLHSVLTLTGVSVGDTFLIQLGGYAGNSGIGVLNISIPPPPTGNDDCSTATPLAGTGIYPYDTTGNTTSGFDGGGSCGAGADTINQDQFYLFTAAVAGLHQFYTCGSDYDTKLSIHDGIDCSAVCLAYNDDACALSTGINYGSRVNATLAVGQTVLVQVGGFGANAGTGILTIDPPAPPPTNDDCSTADPIAGLGTWAFDTSGASTTAFGGGSSCYTNINQDVFYQWTAAAAGDFQIDTEGSTFDTVLNVHTGIGCAATCLAWNDDGGTGLLSKIIVQGINAGDTLLIQVGGFGTSFGTGSLNVATWTDPCLATPPDQFAPNHSCAAAAAIADGTYSLSTCKTEPDYFSLTVPDGGTISIDVLFATATADLDAMLFESTFCDDNQGSACGGTLACGFSASDNENLVWSNTTGTDMDCILRVHVWPGTAGDTNTYDLTIIGAGASGPALFCNPANTHSGGTFATLGTSSQSGPGVFHLEATNGPASQFAYFLISGTPMDPGVSVSQGQLCLGAPQGRYSPAAGGALNSISQFDGAGVLQNLAGTSSVGSGYDIPAVLPSPPGGVIAAGDTWHFQLWFRDGAASNFSDGISVTF